MLMDSKGCENFCPKSPAKDYRKHPAIRDGLEALKEAKYPKHLEKEIEKIARDEYSLPASYKRKTASDMINSALSLAMANRSRAVQIMLELNRYRHKIESLRDDASDVVVFWREVVKAKNVATKNDFMEAVARPFTKRIAKVNYAIYMCDEVKSAANRVIDTVEAMTRAFYATKGIRGE